MVAYIILIMVFFLNVCDAEEKLVNKEEDCYYKYYNGRETMLKKKVCDQANIGKKVESPVNLSFPYQVGWPVEIPSSAWNPLTVGDITGDGSVDLYVSTYWDNNFIFNKSGNIINHIDYGGDIAVFYDIDYDGVNEIIGNQGCEDINGCGVTVRKYDGWKLNGFPNPPKTEMFSSSVADIDRDGNYEILFANSDSSAGHPEYRWGLYVLGSWGGLLPGFPVIFPYDGINPPHSGGRNYASPSTGDFDNDGWIEIAVGAGNGNRLYLIRADGSHYRNWPIKFYGGEVSYSPPALADIDNDGTLEIAIHDNHLRKIWVFNDNASILNGFPVDFPANWTYMNPVIADINGDGNLELYAAISCNGYAIYAYNNDGSLIPGWPVWLEVNGHSVSFNSSPSIADIDGDGEMEIIAAGGTCDWCSWGVLIAYNFDGTIVKGFPIVEEHYGFIGVGVSLADLDNDGDIEICTGSEFCDSSDLPAYVYCYDLPDAYNEEKIAWNNYAHDIQHTGRYVNPAIKPPVVQSVNPNSDSYKGGRIVEIKGQNFMPGAMVFFDGIPSSYVQVADATTIFAKVPAHKPCYRYINEPSVSPYQLSAELANQQVVNSSRFNVQDSMLEKERSASTNESSGFDDVQNNSINSMNLINETNTSGCLVNIVVAHPSPDQRQGVLRGAFTYTGYKRLNDDIVLTVSKYAPMGTFENYGAHWRWMSLKGLWNIIDENSNCVPKPYPSGDKAAYYGNKASCTYNNGFINNGKLMMPYIKIDRADATISFMYYRDVEYNPLRNADKLWIEIWGLPPTQSLWVLDSTIPSEQGWIQSPELPLGRWVGQEIRVLFGFDVVDTIDNDHTGIAIDNIQLKGAHWSPWEECSGEVILNWTGGLPKYFIYRGTNPDFDNNIPELRAYTAFTHKYENSLNDEESYYYFIK